MRKCECNTILTSKHLSIYEAEEIEKLLSELAEHPRIGTGHPEPLVGGEGNIYSRHITAHDRIIYRIYDDIVVVLIITIEGHYDDK